MSYLLLKPHHYVHTIQDDMESFVYVMIYFGLRYLQHSSDYDTTCLLKRIFDFEMITKDGLVIGGWHKRMLMSNFWISLGGKFEFFSTPFQKWFEWAVQATEQWIEHYEPSMKARATQDAEPQLQFSDHSNMARTFIECLNSQDWPIDEPHSIDAAPEADRSTTRISKRPFDSEYIDEDGT
ncbi:hypothetical protein C0992_001429, partial [Termitomyces sp. T32_za158]